MKQSHFLHFVIKFFWHFILVSVFLLSFFSTNPFWHIHTHSMWCFEIILKMLECFFRHDTYKLPLYTLAIFFYCRCSPPAVKKLSNDLTRSKKWLRFKNQGDPKQVACAKCNHITCTLAAKTSIILYHFPPTSNPQSTELKHSLSLPHTQSKHTQLCLPELTISCFVVLFYDTLLVTTPHLHMVISLHIYIYFHIISVHICIGQCKENLDLTCMMQRNTNKEHDTGNDAKLNKQTNK